MANAPSMDERSLRKLQTNIHDDDSTTSNKYKVTSVEDTLQEEMRVNKSSGSVGSLNSRSESLSVSIESLEGHEASDIASKDIQPTINNTSNNLGDLSSSNNQNPQFTTLSSRPGTSQKVRFDEDLGAPSSPMESSELVETKIASTVHGDNNCELDLNSLDSTTVSLDDDASANTVTKKLLDMKQSETIQKLASMIGKKVPEKKKEVQVKEVVRNTTPVEKSTYGMDLGKLRAWSQDEENEKLVSEMYRQEFALSKMKGFMHAILLIVKLQNWWRMLRAKAKFAEWRAERNEMKQRFYRGWKIYFRAEKMRNMIMCGKPLKAWIQEIADEKRLSALVGEFFKRSIARSRLTPQAVMTFFSSEEVDISEQDRNKIRRLILTRLFRGWQLDIKQVLRNRFRAGILLARCLRRGNTTLWAKENLFLVYHTWRRYISVNLAYKRDLPIPRFTLPHIPGWSKLSKEITMKKLKKQRAAGNYEKLLHIRWFRSWQKMMTVDKASLMTPDEVAEHHYHMLVVKRHLLGWHTILTERGSIMRVRDRCFAAWKIYAPRRRKLRYLATSLGDWQILCMKAKAYRAMTMCCKGVIEQRTATLYQIQQRSKDRKFLICVFALTGYQANVIFIDCWRRWRKWISMRMSWRLAARQIRYEWCSIKIITIFKAWRALTSYKDPDLIQGKMQRADNTSRTSRTILKKQAASALKMVMETNGNDRNVIDDGECSLEGSLSSNDYDDENIMVYEDENLIDGETDDAEFEYSDMSDDIDDDEDMDALNESNQEFLRNIAKKNSEAMLNIHADTEKNISNNDSKSKSGRRLNRKVHTMDVVTRMTRKAIKVLADSQGQSSKKHSAPMQREVFEFLCRAQACNNENGCSENHEDFSELPGPPSASTRYPMLKELLHRLSKDRVVTASERRTAATERDNEVTATQKLQEALDNLRIDEAMEAIEMGAVVTSAHVHQCSKHIGDEFVPLLNALITASESYTTTRIFKQDKEKHVMECANPVGAVMMSMHLDRWDRQDLTSREIVCLEEDMVISKFAGGPLQSLIIWKLLALFLAEKKAKFMEDSLLVLRRDRTVDMEVQEVLKTKKVDRLRQIAATLRSLICRSAYVKPEPCNIKLLPEPELMLRGVAARMRAASNSKAMASRPLVKFNNESEDSLVAPKYKSDMSSDMEGQQQLATGDLDIFQVLHEYIRMTNLLISDAVMMRRPHLERDKRLVRNGFLKQARLDFLRLREECLTEKQRKERARQERRKALLAKKKAKKAKLKAARKAKAAKKKAKAAAASVTENGHIPVKEGSLSVEFTEKIEKGNDEVDVDGADNDPSRPGTALTEGGEDTDGLVDTADEGGGPDDDDEAGDDDNVAGGLELPHESTIVEEEAWVARTKKFDNLLFERYSWGIYNGLGQISEVDEITDDRWYHPNLHEFPDRQAIHMDLIKRRIREAENGVKRTTTKMHQEGLPVPPLREVEHEGSGKLFGWIIRTFYKEENEDFRNAAVWTWLPLGWWRQARIKQCISIEQDYLQSKEIGLENNIQAIAFRKSDVDLRKDKLVRFLKASRSEMVAIGNKSSIKHMDDAKIRQEKDKTIAKAAQKIEKCKLRVLNERKIVSTFREKLEDETVESLFHVVDNLGMKEYAKQPNKKRKTPDEALQAKMRAEARAILDAKERNIPELEEDIQTAINKHKEAEKEKEKFDYQTFVANDMMQGFACERFKVLLDVQELVLSIGVEIKAFEDESDGRREVQESIREYRNTICSVFDDVEKLPPPENGVHEELPEDREKRLLAEAAAAEEEEYLRRRSFAPTGDSMGRSLRESLDMLKEKYASRPLKPGTPNKEMQTGLDSVSEEKGLTDAVDSNVVINTAIGAANISNDSVSSGDVKVAQDNDIVAELDDDKSVDSVGAQISNTMESHQLGFARPPTIHQQEEMARKAAEAKEAEDERISRALEEKEISEKVTKEYWENLESEDEEEERKRAKKKKKKKVPKPEIENTFVEEASLHSTSTFVTQADNKTASLWRRARKSLGWKHRTQEVHTPGIANSGEKDAGGDVTEKLSSAVKSLDDVEENEEEEDGVGVTVDGPSYKNDVGNDDDSESTGSPVMNTKMFRWQKETQVDYVDPTPPLNSTDPPVFIPPMSPSKISIPGRWQEGDAAWTPNFKVKPSIGFTSTEHPDRPTLLSELAAERAKEEEDAKTNAAASSRRKNELDDTKMITDPFIAYGLSQAKWVKGLVLTDQLVNIVKQQSGVSSTEATKYILDQEMAENDDLSNLNNEESSGSEGDERNDIERSDIPRGGSRRGKKQKGLKLSGLGKGILAGANSETVLQKRERRFKEEIARRNDGKQRFSYDSISATASEQGKLNDDFSKTLSDIEEKEVALESVTAVSMEGDEGTKDYHSIDPHSISITGANVGMDPPDDDSLGLQSAGIVSVTASDQNDKKSPTDDLLASIHSSSVGMDAADNNAPPDELLASIQSQKSDSLQPKSTLAEGGVMNAADLHGDINSDGKKGSDDKHRYRQLNGTDDSIHDKSVSQSSIVNGGDVVVVPTGDFEGDELRRQRDDKDMNLEVLHRPSITSYTVMSDELDEEEEQDDAACEEVIMKPVTKQSIKISSPMKNALNDVNPEKISAYPSQSSDTKDSLNIKGSKINRASLVDKDEIDSLNLSVSKDSDLSVMSQLQVPTKHIEPSDELLNKLALAIDVFSQREKFRQTLSRGGLSGAAVRARTASRQSERGQESRPINPPVYPGMPLPKSATSKAVLVGGKWELRHDDPFVSTLNLNPKLPEGQELSLQGSPKRPITNPVDKERQAKKEQEAENMRLLRGTAGTAGITDTSGNVPLLRALGLENNVYNDDIDMIYPYDHLDRPGSRPADEYDSIRYIEKLREGLRSKGDSLINFVENEIKRMDAERETGNLGFDVSSRISMAAAEEAPHYSSSNDLIDMSLDNAQMNEDGSVSYSNNTTGADDFNESSGAGTSFDFFRPERSDRIKGAVEGFGNKFLEITANTPKPPTPIKDRRDTQAILRRTQDIKKERWLNNDTMGAVNDLGNAIVVGRNLGHGKEESDINDYDTDFALDASFYDQGPLDRGIVGMAYDLSRTRAAAHVGSTPPSTRRPGSRSSYSSSDDELIVRSPHSRLKDVHELPDAARRKLAFDMLMKDEDEALVKAYSAILGIKADEQSSMSRDHAAVSMKEIDSWAPSGDSLSADIDAEPVVSVEASSVVDEDKSEKTAAQSVPEYLAPEFGLELDKELRNSMRAEEYLHSMQTESQRERMGWVYNTVSVVDNSSVVNSQLSSNTHLNSRIHGNSKTLLSQSLSLPTLRRSPTKVAPEIDRAVPLSRKKRKFPRTFFHSDIDFKHRFNNVKLPALIDNGRGSDVEALNNVVLKDALLTKPAGLRINDYDHEKRVLQTHSLVPPRSRGDGNSINGGTLHKTGGSLVLNIPPVDCDVDDGTRSSLSSHSIQVDRLRLR